VGCLSLCCYCADLLRAAWTWASGGARATMTVMTPSPAAMSVKRPVFCILTRAENPFDLPIGIGVVDHQLAFRLGYGVRIRPKAARVGLFVGVKLLVPSPQGDIQRFIGIGGVCECGRELALLIGSEVEHRSQVLDLMRHHVRCVGTVALPPGEQRRGSY
jgi:hypothetical protein